MVVRDPSEVAWSLFIRDGMSTLTSLALWSSYNRSAVQGLAGLPVHVCRYDELVDDTESVLTSITASLRDWGELPHDPIDFDAAAARIRPELRRNTWPRGQGDLFDVASEIAALDKCLKGLNGRHDVFEIETVPEPAFWEYSLLEERRHGVVRLHAADADIQVLRQERIEMVAELDALREERSEMAIEVDSCRREAAELSLELRALCDEVDSWRELQGDVASLRQNADVAQRELELIQKSRTFRYTASVRAAYAKLRRLVGLS